MLEVEQEQVVVVLEVEQEQVAVVLEVEQEQDVMVVVVETEMGGLGLEAVPGAMHCALIRRIDNWKRLAADERSVVAMTATLLRGTLSKCFSC